MDAVSTPSYKFQVSGEIMQTAVLIPNLASLHIHYAPLKATIVSTEHMEWCMLHHVYLPWGFVFTKQY